MTQLKNLINCIFILSIFNFNLKTEYLSLSNQSFNYNCSTGYKKIDFRVSICNGIKEKRSICSIVHFEYFALNIERIIQKSNKDISKLIDDPNIQKFIFRNLFQQSPKKENFFIDLPDLNFEILLTKLLLNHWYYNVLFVKLLRFMFIFYNTSFILMSQNYLSWVYIFKMMFIIYTDGYQ